MVVGLVFVPLVTLTIAFRIHVRVVAKKKKGLYSCKFCLVVGENQYSEAPRNQFLSRP